MFAYDGPDISSFQPVGDWATVAATGARFAGIRIGNGPFSEWRDGAVRVHRGFIDPHAVDNLVGARPVMRWRALYYVVTPLETPDEARDRIGEFFVSVGLWRPGDLIAIDYEGNPNRDPDGNLVAPDEYCSPEQVEAIRLELAAQYGPGNVGIYGSLGWLEQLDLPTFGWRWLARYTLDVRAKAAQYGCEIFQWTSSAQCAGIAAGRVDMNEVLDAAGLDRAAGVQEVAPVGSPQGSLDVAEGLPGGRVHVAGWMYDPDVPGDSIDAHVYLNGALVGVTRADRERTDVNEALGITGGHGFDAVFDLSVPVQVDVYGINVGDGANAHVGGRPGVQVPIAAAGAQGPAGDTGPAGPTGDTGPFDPQAVRALVRAEIEATPFETKAVAPAAPEGEQ